MAGGGFRVAGGLGSGLAHGAGFAGLGCGTLGFTFGMGGTAGPILGGRQGIARVGQSRRRLRFLFRQAGTALGQQGGLCLRLGQVVRRGVAPGDQFGGARPGLFQPLRPAGLVLGDLVQAPGTVAALAAQFVKGRAARHGGDPRGLDPGAGMVQGCGRIVPIRQFRQCRAGLGQTAARVIGIRPMPGQFRACRFSTAAGHR